MKADVVLDFHYPYPIEEVWYALTDSKMLEKWIWQNNFKPAVGQKFQFQSKPTEYWDGIVSGEVLEAEEPDKLAYIWASAGETTTVSWTLQTEAGGTHLHFEQAGFSEDVLENKEAIGGAESSWKYFGEKLAEVLKAT